MLPRTSPSLHARTFCVDLIDALQALSARIETQLAHVQTEEATKNALILPFINALGYNVFDLTIVSAIAAALLLADALNGGSPDNSLLGLGGALSAAASAVLFWVLGRIAEDVHIIRHSLHNRP